MLAALATDRRSLIDNALLLVDTNADGIPDAWSASFGSGYTLNANFEVVPSPAAAGLLGLGALAAGRRRRTI